MDDEGRIAVLNFGVWSALIYLVAVFGGWGLAAGFLPATPPSFTADQILALYQTDFQRIRIGMVILMFAALAFIPFAATAGHFIAQVERGPGVLTFMFLLGAVGNMVLTFYPAVWWLAAAFRPERAADLIYLVNDLAWLQFLGGISMYLAMPISILVASLLDRRQDPPFPRWAGYLNIFFAIAIIPDQLLFFFHKGPFAWNGLFGLWLPVFEFAGFFIVNFVVLRRAVAAERRRMAVA